MRPRLLLDGLIVGAAIFLFIEWRGSRDALLKMNLTVQQQQQTIVESKQAQQALEQEVVVRDEQTRKQVTELQTQVERYKSSADIAKYLQTVTNKETPVPISVTVPASPQAPVTATIPQADMQAIRDLVAKCQACEVELPTCQADKSNLQTQLKTEGEQLSATERQRDAAIKAAKGGSFLRRVATAAKWIVVGGVIGFTVARATP